MSLEITPADTARLLPLSVIIEGYFRGWRFRGWGYCDGHETAGTGTVSFAACPLYDVVYNMFDNIVGSGSGSEFKCCFAWAVPETCFSPVSSRRPIKNDIIPPISYRDIENFNNYRRVMRKLYQIVS